MAKCYTLKKPIQKPHLQQQPKVQVLKTILDFSKSFEVVRSKDQAIGIVLN